ncbi:hypothetical protein LTR49_026125 [Elasticomyces elasticus]|nr:hypothetical protein LTR49_026125 [Elasticomyces elasticus]
MIFAEELIAAYPKLSATAWAKSFGETVYHYQRRKHFPQGLAERVWAFNVQICQHDEVNRLIMTNTPLRHFPKEGEQWYHDHNQMIRDLVPPKELLEFNAKQSWLPICEFLERPVPAAHYPRTNESALFKKTVDGRWERFKLQKYSYFLRWFSLFMIGVATICSLRLQFG